MQNFMNYVYIKFVLQTNFFTKRKRMKNYVKHSILSVLMLFAVTSFLSCGTKITGASGVTNFDVSKYLGKWYEIARYDSWFEKNMDKTQAFYSLNEDGTVRVENSGYDVTKGKWKTSVDRKSVV